MVVLGALAVGLFGTAVVLARHGPPTGTLALPARNDGDAGTYEVEQTSPDAGSERQRIFATQQTVGLRTDGSRFTTLAVHEAWVFSKNDTLRETWRTSMDDGLTPTTSERLVKRTSFSGLYCEPGLLGCTTVSIAENALYEISSDNSRIEFGLDGGLCGLRNAAQGTTVDLAHPVVFLGDCATPHLKAIQATSLPEHERVIIFSGTNGTRLSQVWLAADLAYPIRVWNGFTNGTGNAYALLDFQSGKPAPPQTMLPPPIPLPVGSGRTPNGPDATGFPVPWPLDDALQRARSLQDSPLNEFLQQHPEAQLAAASFSEATNGHWRQRTWKVEYAATQPWAVAIHLDEPEEGEPAITAPFYSTNPQAATDGDFYLSDQEPRPDLAPFDQLPSKLPAVREAAAAYAALRPSSDSDGDPNAWAFAITCPPPCDGNVSSWVAAGHFRSFTNRVGATERVGVEPNPNQETHILMVATNLGSLAFIDRGNATRSPYDHQPPPMAGSGPEWTMTKRVIGYEWTNPAPLSALGAGLAALVATLLLLANALRHGGVGLFSRIAPDALSTHPTRALLVQAIEDHPGAHAASLAQRLNLASGVLQHHLGKLVAAGQITQLAQGAKTHYFPAHTQTSVATKLAAASNPGAQAILEAVRARPGASVSQLAVATQRTIGTISHHLNRLERAGLIERRRNGRTVGVYPLF